ncbi:hypothetical protein ACH5RR_035813, partial [Cinchona calisaya]
TVTTFFRYHGYLYAVCADNGALIWKQNPGNLTGLPPTGAYVNVTVSRSTPTIANDLLIMGIYGPAVVFAVKRLNGQLVWLSHLDPRPLAVITASGTFYMGAFYVGVSSLEELLPIGQCCIFRGSMVKLDARSCTILWQTYTVPDNGGKVGGYAGAAIWGSSPSIDVFRGLVYIATGNLYNAPPEVLKCEEAQNNQTSPPNPNNPDCPPGPYNDAAFGEAPMLLSILRMERSVQKSGFAWALDHDNGDIVWFKRAGPGSIQGGGIWGAAADGKRVYTNIVNGDRLPFTLAPSTQTTTAGAWVALDANTGEILWSTANPSLQSFHSALLPLISPFQLFSCPNNVIISSYFIVSSDLIPSWDAVLITKAIIPYSSARIKCTRSSPIPAY